MVRPPYTPRTGRQIPPTGDVRTGTTAFYLAPSDRRYFVGGNCNHVTSAATATREYAAATAAIHTAFPTSSCRSTRTRPLAAPLHPHTTPDSTAPPARPAPITTGSDAPAHAHNASHPAPTRLYLSHNTMVQTGRHPNEIRLRFLVRYISMKLRPTPAEFIAATTAFPRPKRPQRHPVKPPTHAPTAPPPTPEPRPPSFYDYQLHPRD